MNDIMNRVRVLAIDDEPLALRQLASYVDRVPELLLVANCQSAVEAMSVLSREDVDAIFCDINMPDLNGMDLVRTLGREQQSSPLVVFTTAYSQYALEGFELAAVDFLLKPYSFMDFKRAADRLVERKRQLEAVKQSEKNNPELHPDASEVLYVRADHRTQAIPFRDIRYVQAMGEYLRIFTDSQPRPLMALLSMKRMSEMLPREHFMRIHRSHIINLNRIAHFSKGSVTLTDGTVLNIGDNYRADVEAWVAKRKA